MAETIKCACGNCGAKYRLPLEAQGRSARCKKCGQKFAVPREKSLEDSILDWLSEPETEEQEVDQPRVISMTTDNTPAKADAARRGRGPIRMKTGTTETE